MSNNRNEKSDSPNVEVTRDWTRPDPLRVEGKDESKAYRWVDKAKVEQRKYEGYKFTDSDSVRYESPDGSSGDGAPQYRELVLMEMHKERAEARNEHYRHKASRATEAARERFIQQMRRMGVRTDV